MRRKIRTIIIIIVVIIVILILAVLLSSKRTPSALLFVSLGCPHCQNVEDYLNAHNQTGRLQITVLEVSQNPANARQLSEAVQRCGLDTSAGVGVPLLFTASQCFSGDQDIINFLQNQ